MIFTPEKARQQFSALNQLYNDKPVVFFDGPGGSQVPTSVLEGMNQYLGYYNSNTGGHYFSSQLTDELVEKAREHVQAFFNAESKDNVIFGANMTSLTFQLSRAISRDWTPEDEIIVTALDHSANVSTWEQAAQDKQTKVHKVGAVESDCTLDLAHLESLINPKTKLIAVTMASNCTGSIVDVEQVVSMAKKVGAKVYVDAVHYAPHHAIDVKRIGCDFLACSAYKFFGPHIGMAYVAPQWLQVLQPYKVEPATDIGPGRFETGTPNFEAIAGVIEAINYIAQWGGESETLRERIIAGYQRFAEHEEKLSQYFLNELSSIRGAKLFGIEDASTDLRTPTFAIRIEGHHPELIAKTLGEQNICVWNGHFYALGLIKQLDLLESGGVVRIGFMHYNTIEEIDQLFNVLAAL